MINLDKHICKAKELNTGGWVYGYYVSKTDPLVGCAYPYILCQEYNSSTGLLDSFITWYRVDPDTVCRYTGIEDKYGNPIFEHDILSGIFYFIGPEETIFEVCWQDDIAGWGVNNFKLSECVFLYNKFDNTELMEAIK